MRTSFVKRLRNSSARRRDAPVEWVLRNSTGQTKNAKKNVRNEKNLHMPVPLARQTGRILFSITIFQTFFPVCRQTGDRQGNLHPCLPLGKICFQKNINFAISA